MAIDYDFITLKVEGLSELAKELRELPKQLEGRVLGAGVKTMANVIRDQARANLRANQSVDTGLLLRSIVSWRMRGSQPDNMTYQVGVTMKKKGFPGLKTRGKSRVRQPVRKKRSAFYWRFVEFGTVKMGAKPFLRPAFDSMAGTAIGLFKNVVQRGISIAVSKMRMLRER